MLLCLARDL